MSEEDNDVNDEVVAEFDVLLGPSVPIEKMVVTVLDVGDGVFQARSDMHVLHKITGEPEFEVGIGKSVTLAVNDKMRKLMQFIKENEPDSGWQKSDFLWTHPGDW